MKFYKMQGAGNDFVLFDGINNDCSHIPSLAKKICDRKFGVGGDGIMIALPSKTADIKMVYYNSDGSLGEMCGNGIRCFSKFVYDTKLVKSTFIKIETDAGIKEAKLFTDEMNLVQKIKIFMGNTIFDPKKIPVNVEGKDAINKKIIIDNNELIFSTILVGVPHTVIICKNLENVEVDYLGSLIEKHSIFPKKTNVNFIEIINNHKIKIKTWERGAGRTLACGTGSCASAFLANYFNLTNSIVEVETEGGNILVELGPNGIYMTGSAEITFKGEILWV